MYKKNKEYLERHKRALDYINGDDERFKRQIARIITISTMIAAISIYTNTCEQSKPIKHIIEKDSLEYRLK